MVKSKFFKMTPISMLFICSALHSFGQYLFYAYYVPGTMKTFAHLFPSVVII